MNYDMAKQRSGLIRETLVVAVLLLAMLLLGFWTVGGTVLVTRPLWLDEYHTLLVANAGLLEGIRALAAGADVHPPLLYILLSPLRLGSDIDAVKLRLFSLAAVIVGLLFLYLTLRRFAKPVAAFAGIVAVWAHPLLLRHSFEGRHYGPFFLMAAFLAFSVGLDRSSNQSFKRDAAIAVSSVLLCTIHYFGVLAWFLIFSASFVTWSVGRSSPVRRSIAFLAGPVALGTCLPFYVGQREVFGYMTWVPRATVEGAERFVADLYLWLPLVVCLLAWFVLTVYQGRNSSSTTTNYCNRADTNSLLALSLLPALVIAVSFLVQPSMVPRYAVATLLFYAPVFAIVLTHVFPWARIAALAILVGWFLTKSIDDADREAKRHAEDVSVNRRMVDSVGAGQLVIAPFQHSLYPLMDEDNNVRLAFPVFSRDEIERVYPPGAAGEAKGRLMQMMQMSSQVHASRFGFPTVLSAENIRRETVFWLLLSNNQKQVREYTAAFLPTHSVEQRGARLYRLELR